MLSVTVDLTQLHVTGALGALGGIMKIEAYDKVKISGSNLSRGKYFQFIFKMAAYEGA